MIQRRHILRSELHNNCPAINNGGARAMYLKHRVIVLRRRRNIMKLHCHHVKVIYICELWRTIYKEEKGYFIYRS